MPPRPGLSSRFDIHLVSSRMFHHDVPSIRPLQELCPALLVTCELRCGPWLLSSLRSSSNGDPFRGRRQHVNSTFGLQISQLRTGFSTLMYYRRQDTGPVLEPQALWSFLLVSLGCYTHRRALPVLVCKGWGWYGGGSITPSIPVSGSPWLLLVRLSRLDLER